MMKLTAFRRIALIVMLLISSIQLTHAQSPDCFVDVFERVTMIVGGVERSFDRKIGVEIAPECRRADNRVNVYDRAAGVVIYCLPDDTIALYDIDIRGHGALALTATSAEVAAIPTFPGENTLIKANGVIRLYRLTSGELQVNAPGIYVADPEYVFRWNGCSTPGG